MDIIRIFYLVLCVVSLGFLLHKIFKSEKKSLPHTGESKNKEENPNDNLGVDSSKRDKEDLRYNLEIVNSWIMNCDQKIYVLLSVVGVTSSILLASDFIRQLRICIFKPFIQYWTGEGNLSFSSGRFIIFVLLMASGFIFMLSCRYFLCAIDANIDYDKMCEQNTGLEKKSFIFFGSVSGMEYEEFKNDNFNIENDYKSQIYVNSKIALKKFQNYKKGLSLFKVSLLSSLMLFIAIMFM